MIINDPNLLNQINEWRRKASDGTISLEEMREAVKALRANRLASAEAAAKSTKSGGGGSSGSRKKAAAAVNAGDLLNQLEGL